MNHLAIVAVFAVISTPALAQNTGTAPNSSPSAQGSGVGIAGQPGSESGPSVDAQGHTVTGRSNPTTQQQDTSKIAGKPGSKSGPAVMPPAPSAEKKP